MNEFLKKGFLWGLAATLAMTVVMVIGMTTGMAPMPAPIPVAIMKQLLGELPKPALMGAGILSHFMYGGAAGAVFAGIFRKRLGIGMGLLWGVVLWLIMDLAVLPFLGWGLFGTDAADGTPKIAIATLVLHLIYGVVLGWGCARSLANGQKGTEV